MHKRISTVCMQRHRAVNRVLAEELADTVHALSIDARAPQQAATRHVRTPCLGGSLHDRHADGTS